MTHQCPAPGCRAAVPADQLACRIDWYRLPKPYRDAVWRAWDRGSGAGTAQHTRAVGAAIGWLERNPRPA